MPRELHPCSTVVLVPTTPFDIVVTGAGLSARKAQSSTGAERIDVKIELSCTENVSFPNEERASNQRVRRLLPHPAQRRLCSPILSTRLFCLRCLAEPTPRDHSAPSSEGKPAIINSIDSSWSLPSRVGSLHRGTRALVLPEQAMQAIDPEPARFLLQLPGGLISRLQSATVPLPAVPVGHRGVAVLYGWRRRPRRVVVLLFVECQGRGESVDSEVGLALGGGFWDGGC